MTIEMRAEGEAGNRRERASARASAGRRALAALRRPVDRIIAACSLVPVDPVIDVRRFGWTGRLRREWRAIRDEAVALAGDRPGVELWRDGARIDAVLARCPATAAALAAVPDLDRAGFAALPPGAQVAGRCGPGPALLTCHLGLVVPRDGDVRMRLGDRVLRWAEGETLIFDDSRPHMQWNDSSGARLMLWLRFRRPLRQPGKWIADALLRR